MSASVVGIDIGSFSSYVVVAKQGGVESLPNEYSDRNTPTCVSFNDNMRYIGHEAKQQQISNVKNTICAFNHFIGKKYNDPSVIIEAKRNLCNIVEAPEKRVGFQVNYLGERQVFSAEQIYAMQLTKLKDVTEMNLKTKVVDIVINVPTNATNCERRAIFDAARIANLNCIRLINDTTSSALAYGFYRQDLPNLNDKSKIVAFVDMGYSNFQSTLVAFNKGNMKVISSSCDNIGGRDLDEVIYNYVKSDFKEKYKLIVEDDKKSGIRLMQECEKLKKLMNANSTAIPMNIECFMNDIDVSTKMSRSEFEKLASCTLFRVRITLDKLLKYANLTPDQVDSVEIVGGSTRVSAVKDIITDVFKQELRMSLNSDEAVAKGCAIQCAILSPALRVREFCISDVCPYSIVFNYDDNNGKQCFQVFPKWHSFPVSRHMIFKRSNSFDLDAKYGDEYDLPSDRSIGLFHVLGVSTGINGRLSNVKVKMRVNANGIFTCCQAQRIVNADSDELVGGEDYVRENKYESKKMVTVIDLPVEATILQYFPSRIKEYNELENQMIQQVKLEKERTHAKNSVEEYVYEMKDKLYGKLESFVSDLERDQFCKELTDAENWLYNEGENVPTTLYLNRLSELRKTGDIILGRAREIEERHLAVEEFGRVCMCIQKVISGIDYKDEVYNYLGTEDREVLAKVLGIEQAWFSQVMLTQRCLGNNESPSVTVSDINAHRETLEMVAGPIIDRSPSNENYPLKDTSSNDDNDSWLMQSSSDMDLD